MKISFPFKSPTDVLSALSNELSGRELGKIVSLSLDGKDLVVTLSKLGTSVLAFTQGDKKDGLEFTLTKEKIALTHRAFKDEVKDKLVHLVEKIGGKVLSR